MIVLFTDFGLHGPYTGQVKAVLHQMAPGIPAIDLFADAPVGSPKPSAYLLGVYAGWFPVGTVFLCIVDPGVGGTRPAIVLEADGRWYVGPGNAYCPADASQETLAGQMRLGMLALAVARVVEHCRWRARATKRPVVPDVNPASPAGPRQPRRAS